MYKKLIKQYDHWTFGYIYNRLKLAVRQIFYPNDPWLTKDAIFILNQLLKSSDIGLEFGSGRSTIWLASRIKKLISVEHNKFWFDEINKKINDKKIKNIDYYLMLDKDYISILDKLENNSRDFILVDGLLRDLCTKKSILKIKSGGLLIIDNINRYIPSNTCSPILRKKMILSQKSGEKFF